MTDPTETRAFWQGLGLPGLFDVHTHFLPPPIQRAVWAVFPHPYVRQLEGLARLDLGDDWLRAVCWDNGVGLFGEHRMPSHWRP